MKELIAMSVFFLIAGTGIYLAVKKHTGTGFTAMLLLFSLISGLAIANYDWMNTLQWHVPGLEVYQEQVSLIRKAAMDDFCGQIQSREEELRSVLASVDDAQESLAVQRQSLESLLESVSRAQETMASGERNICELNARTEELERRILEIHNESGKLALSMTRLIWLLLEAREEYGEERAQLAVQKLLDEMDGIVSIVIVDPKARADFVKEVMHSLPSRRQ
jgi:chromosome segregation ATPase